MVHRVRLKFFEDEIGDFGVAHEDSIENGFNAFWDGRGIFHDVFEHYFEGKHPYFKDDYAFNIGGELAAMGHMAYYYYGLGLKKRIYPGGYATTHQGIIDNTQGAIETACLNGQYKFGDELLCRVPPQKHTGEYMLEYIIDDHFAQVMECLTNEIDVLNEYAEIISAMNFRRSMDKEKFRRLYRWGWYRAEKMFAGKLDLLHGFIETWDEFCREYDAANLAQDFKYLIITIRTGSWSAYFETPYGTKVRWQDLEARLLSDEQLI